MELRFDAFTGTSTIVAAGRHLIAGPRFGGLPVIEGPCPFCPGNERETEVETLVVGDPWRVRIVRNRYPIVHPEPPTPTVPHALSATGYHEVVIESARHDGDLTNYDLEHAIELWTAIRERVRALESEPGIRYVATFRNRGRRAGSSQPHPHSQIAAMTIVPALAEQRSRVATPTLLSEVITEERRAKTRVIFDEDGVMAWCPFASHRAWEVRVALDEACPRFGAISDDALARLISLTLRVIGRLQRALGEMDYNVIVRDPPVGRASFFTIDILPRTGGDAGFELTTGAPVCVVAPEAAAESFRAAVENFRAAVENFRAAAD